MGVQRHKSTLQIVFLSLSACCGSFLFGYALGVVDLIQKPLDTIFGITNPDMFNSILTTMAPVGGMFGSMFAAILLQYFTIKKSLILSNLLGIFATSFCIIKNIYVLISARFGVGFAAGLYSALVPLYIERFSPEEISGLTGSLNQTFINVGIIGAYVMAIGYSGEVESGIINGKFYEEYYWRIILLFPILTCGLHTVFLTVCYTQEPPQYYANKGDDEGLEKVVQRFYKQEYHEEVISDFKCAKSNEDSDDTWGNVVGKYRRRVILGSMLCMIQQFSGINSVIFYSFEIFEGATGSGKMAYYLTIVSGVVLMLSAIAGGYFTNLWGRKTILQGGTFLCFITLATLGVLEFLLEKATKGTSEFKGLSIGIIIIIYLYEIAFGVSLGPIVWLYLPEVLNNKGMSVAACWDWIGTVIIGLIFLPMKRAMQMSGVFFFFAACCALGMVYMQIEVKETKGLKKGAEINRLFGDCGETEGETGIQDDLGKSYPDEYLINPQDPSGHSDQ